jgi:hypothetical protein
MIGYRDRMYCNFWRNCKDGETCERALTEFILMDARSWWGKEGAPIDQFIDTPDCWRKQNES